MFSISIISSYPGKNMKFNEIYGTKRDFKKKKKLLLRNTAIQISGAFPETFCDITSNYFLERSS